MRPRPLTESRTTRRPSLSASDVMGRAPKDARRMHASPRPSAVPESPAWSATVVPLAMCPNVRATSPRAATAPNCPTPEANEIHATGEKRSVGPSVKSQRRDCGFRSTTSVYQAGARRHGRCA